MDAAAHGAAGLESTWAAQPDLPPVDPGLVERLPAEDDADASSGCIGAYEMARRLGEGEFATVYECWPRLVGSRRRIDNNTSEEEDDDDDDDDASCGDNSDDDRRRRQTPVVRFAIKAINKAKVQRHVNILKSKRNIRRVNTEVAAMRRCSHGGICQLYDVMQSPTHVYLVMEMGDRDLYSFLDEHPDGCPETVMKSIARILALALRHCHNHLIAHRDIKPENVLVCGSPADWAQPEEEQPAGGVVKLCDFGLCAVVVEPPDGSSSVSPDHCHTIHGGGAYLTDFVGSPGFFAPELMTRRRYDGRVADMWSLGAVMVEMLLGHKTFDALWCPPYEQLSDVRAFSAGVADAVHAVKLGASASGVAPSEPVRQLLEDLLQVEPERRATIQQICTATWFDLLKPTPEGYMQLLRLTLDGGYGHDQPPPRPPGARRVAYRETPRAADRTLGLLSVSSLHSIASDQNLLSFGAAQGVDATTTALSRGGLPPPPPPPPPPGGVVAPMVASPPMMPTYYPQGVVTPGSAASGSLELDEQASSRHTSSS